MAATTTDEQARIDRELAALNKIVKVLAPCTKRSQRRTIAYFIDLCNDPDGEDSAEALRILADVAEVLGVKID